MILMHGFVPDNFGLGVTVPVVKDKRGHLGQLRVIIDQLL